MSCVIFGKEFLFWYPWLLWACFHPRNISKMLKQGGFPCFFLWNGYMQNFNSSFSRKCKQWGCIEKLECPMWHWSHSLAPLSPSMLKGAKEHEATTKSYKSMILKNDILILILKCKNICCIFFHTYEFSFVWFLSNFKMITK